MNLLYLALHKVLREIFFGTLFGIIAGLLQTILMVQFTQAIIHFMQGEDLMVSVNLLIGLSILFILIQLGSKIILNKLNQKIVFYLQTKLADRALKLPYRAFENEGKSNYYATFTQDIGNIATLINGLPNLLNTLVMALSMTIYLTWYSAEAMGIIMAIFIPLFIIYACLDRFVLMKYMERARTTWDSWFKSLRSLLEGKKELTLYEQLKTEFTEKEIEYSAHAYNTVNYRANNAYAYSQMIWSVAMYAVLVGILLFSKTHFTQNVSAALIFFSLIMYVLGAFLSLNLFFPIIRRCLVSLKKIKALNLEESEPLFASSTVLHPSKITLNTVSLHSRDAAGTLHCRLAPVSFSLQRNQITFIVGNNGSGKSTLIKLLSGLYNVESGTITVDHHLIRHEDRGWYRELFSVVFYDFYLFDHILRYVHPKQRERFDMMLTLLKIKNNVKIIDNVILTAALSDGQRKRLALAYAFLYDRPFIIFDEWASDQDPEFKAYFYESILPLLKKQGKSVIVVSHDKQFFSVADQIIDLSTATQPCTSS